MTETRALPAEPQSGGHRPARGSRPQATEWPAIALAVAVIAASVALADWVYRTGSRAPAAQPAARSAVPAATGGDDIPSLPLAGNPQALALAVRSRDVLVGLAATPGGPIDLLVLPSRGAVSPGGIATSVDGMRVSALPCGRRCFRVSVPVLDGAAKILQIDISRPGRPKAVVRFDFPARLPPSGEQLFRAVQRRMRALRSVEFTETLTNGFAVIRTRYAAQAPDRLRYQTSLGDRSILIGQRRWDWDDGRWVESPVPPVRQPSFDWLGARNARLIGRAAIGRTPVRVLAVYRYRYFPLWFRLFVAPDDRVLKSEMLTQSHFMTHRFTGFDRPVQIEPPA